MVKIDLVVYHRSTIRHCASGLRNWPYFVGGARSRHGLDYTPNSYQRQDERTKLVYWDDESLLRSYRTSRRITLSIFIRIRRSVTSSGTSVSLNIYLSLPGMCAFGIIIGEF